MHPSPKLRIMVGFPASGKSGFVSDLEGIVICPDNIRQEIFNTEYDSKVEGLVWFLAKSMARMLLKQGRDVILDATNLTIANRGEWVRLAKELNIEIIAYYVPTIMGVCMERNRKRNRIVPDEVYDRMFESFEEPTEEEGFSQIIVLEND